MEEPSKDVNKLDGFVSDQESGWIVSSINRIYVNGLLGGLACPPQPQGPHQYV